MTQLNLSDAIPDLPRRPVKELKPGERVDQVFLVAKKDLRAAATGGLYIHAVVSDKTGEMVARMWQATEQVYATIPDGGLVQIRGRVDSYKGNSQLIIEGLRPVDVQRVDVSEFMPATKRDIGEMFAKVVSLLAGVKDAGLKGLAQSVLDDEERMRQFRLSPAAIKNHHAFIGGLLEHTLSLMEAAVRLMPQYPQLNPDLVIVGLFLHDIGKTAELSCTMGFQYTDDGHLLGHIYAGTAYVQTKAEELAEAGRPVEPMALKLLLHIILSHHGQMEFGAPVLPKTREAIFVHYLDNLDAKMATLDRMINDAPNDDTGWTSYEPSLGRKVYKSDYSSPHSTPTPPKAAAEKPRRGGLE